MFLNFSDEKVVSGQMNFAKWRLYNNLYEMITKNGGTIFGGCVRDLIERENATKTFYRKCGARIRKNRLAMTFTC